MELQRLQQQSSLDAAVPGNVMDPSSGSLRPLAVNIVDSDDGRWLGVGLFHSRPLIAARVLEGPSPSRPLNAEYLAEKLLDAASRRRGMPADVFLRSPSPDHVLHRRHPNSRVQSHALPQHQSGGAVPAGFYRLIHGESDGLPGLIVDCFGSVVVIQQLTRGKLVQMFSACAAAATK